ncbi:hypothetical protein TURU_027258 [Turdus rufiventris]|nr:hypothetical protein TURU_027258 [Turdus rufiventris]
MKVSQQLPVDYEEKLATFRSCCKSKMSEKNIQADHIININEIPLTFDMPLNRTVKITRISTVSIRSTGNKKASFTVVLSVLSNGQKLPPMVNDSMHAHKTGSVKALVKKTNSELAVIPGGLTKEVQPLDTSVIRSFKVKLRIMWENWMVKGEHSFTKTGRLRQASYATLCQWTVDAWGKVSARTVI